MTVSRWQTTCIRCSLCQALYTCYFDLSCDTLRSRAAIISISQIGETEASGDLPQTLPWWLKLCVFTTGDMALTPGLGTKALNAAWCSQKETGLRLCCVLVAQSCPTLCDPMDCSPPGSSVHGIL